MYQSLVSASVFILTLVAGTLSSGARTPAVWRNVALIMTAALLCGTINFRIRNSRSKLLKFGLRVLNATAAGFLLGVTFSWSARFCGSSTAGEIYWGRILLVLFPTAVGLLAGACGAVGGVADDRRAESRLP